MGRRGATLALAAVSVLVTGLGAAEAGGEPPFGCYERTYGARYLRAHEGQVVRKVRLAIEPLRPVQLASPHGDLVLNADLAMWARGYRQLFASFGVCRAAAGGYDCHGHDLASEDETCARSTTGVHDCRTPARSDRFSLEVRPEGILIRIPEGLMLDAGDSGPYLNLMANDRQNSTFLVPRARRCD